MTAQDVITLVRENMNDLTEVYRIKDPEQLRALDEAYIALLKDRPDLLLSATGTMTATSTISTVDDILIVGDDYRQALASEVCKKLYVKDGEDEQNVKLAGVHQQIYDSGI